MRKVRANFIDYVILKMIEKNDFFSVYELRKKFNLITGLSVAFSSFYRNVDNLKKEGMIVTQPLKLTEKGREHLTKLEKKMLEVLTIISCGK